MNRTKLKYAFNQLANSNKHQLYIYDEVTAYGKFNWNTWEYDDSETSAEYFRQKLNEIPDSDEIELFVNSNGGSVKEGVAIYNMLSRKQCKKTCYIDGFAYSVASVICLACDKIIMGLGTSMMIHDMWMTVSGNARQLRKYADDLDVLMESNRQIYLNRAKNLTEEQLIEMMEAETILTPEQCLEYGFCDEIAQNSIEQNTLLNQQRTLMQQMKVEALNQKSLREEMLQFIKNSRNENETTIENNQENKPQQSNDDKETEEPKQNLMGSFFNAILK